MLPLLRALALVLLLAGLAGLAPTAQAQTADEARPLRVLFVGNSFTYFYNLPQVVSAMAESQGVTLITRQSTVGGSNLEQHWKGERGTQTMTKIAEGDWDYVVFNNHSRSSLDTPESFMTYGGKFADYVREHGAEPIFMSTWAYKSNPLMLQPIAEAHQTLAGHASATLVPCGMMFDEVRRLRPDLEMYFDDKHPSANGTYMLGLIFFKYFTGMSVATMDDRITTVDKDGEKLYLLFIVPEDALFLKQLVDDRINPELR